MVNPAPGGNSVVPARADTPLTERIFLKGGYFFFAAFEKGRRKARVDLTKKRFSLDYFPAVSNVNFKWDM